MEPPATLPDDLLDRPVSGCNLRPGALRDQIDAHRPTLLVFLRHLGCVFCREMVRDLRRAATADPAYPPLLLVFQGTPADGAPFFEQYWPDARAVADHDRTLYDAFGLRQGSAGQIFSPRVWLCGLRAVSKGNVQRLAKPIGDPWMMPGCFVVSGGRVVWRHAFRHAGDHPDFRMIPAVIAGTAADASAVTDAGRGLSRGCAVPRSPAPTV